jgi:hypothetical protein
VAVEVAVDLGEMVIGKDIGMAGVEVAQVALL